jgi:hypothetical protein
MEPGPVPALERVAAVFEVLGVDYYIGGSIASSIHGFFRQTADVAQGRGLDLEYLRGWAATLGVSTELEKALEEAGTQA